MREIKEKKKHSNIYEEWDKVHQIYLELITGERSIQKAGNGEKYAIKI